MSGKNRVLITGASGFVGGSLLAHLKSNGYNVKGTVRHDCLSKDLIKVGDLNGDTNWSCIQEFSPETVIHVAGYAHKGLKRQCQEESFLRSINVDGTLNLARQASKYGVKRFIFISSIGVNGPESTKPFSYDDKPNPIQPYAKSKYDAELGLSDVVEETGLEVVIIRPPLIYGLEAPGNFGKLVHAVNKRLPFPLATINNKRAYVHIGNLCSLIERCIWHPNAANQIYLVSDGYDVSTKEFLRIIAFAINKRVIIFPFPNNMLSLIFGVFKRSDQFRSLCGSLEINIEHTKKSLAWIPKHKLGEAIAKSIKQ